MQDLESQAKIKPITIKTTGNIAENRSMPVLIIPFFLA